MLKAEMIDFAADGHHLSCLQLSELRRSSVEPWSQGMAWREAWSKVFHKHLLAEKYLVQSQASKVHGDRMLEKNARQRQDCALVFGSG